MQASIQDQTTICTCNPNIYKELRAREVEYVQLIKDLYQENQKLKAQIAELKEQVLTSTTRQIEPKAVVLKSQGSFEHDCSNSNLTLNPHQETGNNTYLAVQNPDKRHERTPSFHAPTSSSSELITASDTTKNYPSGSLFSFVDNKESHKSPPQPSIFQTNSAIQQQRIIKIPVETKFNKIFSNLLKSQPNIQVDELFPITTTEIQLSDSQMQNSSKTHHPWNIKTNKSIVARDESRASGKNDNFTVDDGNSEYSELCEFRYGAQLKSLINRGSETEIKQPNLPQAYQQNLPSHRIKQVDHHKENNKHVSFSPVTSNLINLTTRLHQTSRKSNTTQLHNKKINNHEQTIARNRQVINNKVYL